MLKYDPAVFAVGEDYQIMVPVTSNSLFWIEIDGKSFYDEQNGIMRSLCLIHRVLVPMHILDMAKRYTVCEREIIDRKPYFPVTVDTVRTEFEFKPVPNDDIRIYHVADTHNKVEEPVAASRLFGKIDLLIMNGDIPEHSGQISNFYTIYSIAEKITHGKIPIVFARGNHDLRGYHAEEILQYTPNSNGNTYYTFKLGSVWGLVLDCGEDKDDTHAEYGLTVRCHIFRERQTEFIKYIIKNAGTEYNSKGIMHKIIISHNPFTYQLPEPFNIESEIYSEWARLIKENIKPELMICGHLHKLCISYKGDKMDNLGQPSTLIIGSDVNNEYHAGCGLTLKKGSKTEVTFCKSNGLKENIVLEK